VAIHGGCGEWRSGSDGGGVRMSRYGMERSGGGGGESRGERAREGESEQAESERE